MRRRNSFAKGFIAGSLIQVWGIRQFTDPLPGRTITPSRSNAQKLPAREPVEDVFGRQIWCPPGNVDASARLFFGVNGGTVSLGY
jgi:hypothetical protein